MTTPPPPPPPAGAPQGWTGQPPPPQPDSNLVWGILVVVLCGCGLPFGVVSIIQASKVSGLYVQGRYAEAEAASKSAKKWAIIGAVVGIVIGIVWGIIVLAGGMASMSDYSS